MVFPSLFFQNDPGVISQFSGFLVLAFSFLLHRAKKWVLALLVLISLILICQNQAHAFAIMSGQVGSSVNCANPAAADLCRYVDPYQNTLNFYGTPWGQSQPVYFYPSFNPYLNMPYPYYFMPHSPSPYGPGNYCPTCNPIYQNPFPYPNPNTGPYNHNPLFS